MINSLYSWNCQKMNSIKNFNSSKIGAFFLKKQYVIFAYLLLAIVAGTKQYFSHSYNNYLIFKYTFWHTINLQNLYNNYLEYLDSNHYGPVFSILIAPFALLPDRPATRRRWSGCLPKYLPCPSAAPSGHPLRSRWDAPRSRPVPFA